MMDRNLTTLAKDELQKPLRRAVSDRFMDCVRSHGREWGMPAMEAVADFAALRPPRAVSVRIFDMNGDGEVRDPSPALRQALEELHTVSASHGEDWSRLLLTLILSPDRETGRFQWNMSYTR